MTRGQIFIAVSSAIEDNREHQEHFAKLGQYYDYLKTRLPRELQDALDEFYFHTVGIETVIMEVAYKVGAGGR